MKRKESEQYTIAMVAVIRSNLIEAEEKLEIIETLLRDRGSALWIETQKEDAE